jgi:hypothetical protein
VEQDAKCVMVDALDVRVKNKKKIIIIFFFEIEKGGDMILAFVCNYKTYYMRTVLHSSVFGECCQFHPTAPVLLSSIIYQYIQPLRPF